MTRLITSFHMIFVGVRRNGRCYNRNGWQSAHSEHGTIRWRKPPAGQRFRDDLKGLGVSLGNVRLGRNTSVPTYIPAAATRLRSCRSNVQTSLSTTVSSWPIPEIGARGPSCVAEMARISGAGPKRPVALMEARCPLPTVAPSYEGSPGGLGGRRVVADLRRNDPH